MTKPTLRELLNAVHVSLKLASQNKKMRGILINNKDHAAYEAYIYSLLIKSIRKLPNVKVNFKNIQTTSKHRFIFRGSPGQIYGTSHNYSYVEFEYLDKIFELHMDIKYQGVSKVTHEVDISILDKEEADYCRGNGLKKKSNRPKNLTPRARYLRCSFECKFYSNLETHLIRTFIGLLDDMGQVELSCFISNTSSNAIRQYCAGKKSRPFFFQQVVPAHKSDEDKFVNFIEVILQKVLGKA